MEERPNWRRYLVRCVGRKEEGRRKEMAHRVRDLCTGQRRDAFGRGEEGEREGTDIKISGWRKEGFIHMRPFHPI